MKIMHIAPLEEPVPPAKYGGTELVISNIVENQVKLGHEVYLVAAGDSQTTAHLLPVIPQSLRKMFSLEEIDIWRNFLKIYHIADMIRYVKDIKPDVVHNHFAWRLIQFRECMDAPLFSTMHSPLTALQEQYTYSHHADANYVSISNNQRLALPNLNWIKTVYNGIDLSRFPKPSTQKREYFAFLGRTSPEKGLKEICIEIKKTKYKLKIAAKVDTADEKYFKEEIQPLIDGRQIEFLGEVDHAGKVELLQGAKGLLLWLNWEEPFGLVVIEAMACGAPVIVNPRGSMRELMVDGETGFLVNSLEEMGEKMGEVENISSVVCREHVEKHFSAEKMAQEYVILSEQLRG